MGFALILAQIRSALSEPDTATQAEALALNHRHAAGERVLPHRLARGSHRRGVAIECEHLCRPEARGCHGEDSGACADVECAAHPPAASQPVEREQAALRRLVAAGAECGAGVDGDGEATARWASVRAHNREAPNRDGRKGGQGFRFPIGRAHGLDDRAVGRYAGCAEQRQQPRGPWIVGRRGGAEQGGAQFVRQRIAGRMRRRHRLGHHGVRMVCERFLQRLEV